MPLRRLATVLLAAGALLAPPAPAAAQPVRNGAVTVELVAADASLQPGRPFWVALKMNHDAHWHSYWINAGTGYPTSLVWTLPEGFTAGPLVWPAPHTVKDTAGKITGNGYEHEVFLFTRITPPANLAPGTTVTLQAAAEWLMCKDSCMPGNADVALALPVSATTPASDTPLAPKFNRAFADLPEKSAAWAFSATRTGTKITLRVTPRDEQNTHVPSELHYFDEAGVADYAGAQTTRIEGRTLVLEMAAATDAPGDAAGLKGVLTAANGFAAGRGYGGVLVETPFVVKEPPIATAPPTTSNGSSASSTPPPAAPQLGEGGSAPSAQPGSLLGTLFLAFVGGLILNLMPCVFPVLGIKIMGFVNQSGSDKAKVVQHGLVFAAGVLVSFWTLAGLLLALRSGGAQLGWGFQLQSPAFVFSMAAFMLIFALNMSGLFEVGLSATGAGANLQSKDGLAGSFFTGALATLVATPCSAPFLAPALGAALALSAVESLLVFTAIAVGLALPYLLLSMFPQAIKALPRPGAWMETFKQFMAFPLYATVGWLLWVLAGQTAGDDTALLNIALGFVLIAMAAWLYGRFGQTYGQSARQLFGKISAALLLVAGLWLGWPKDMNAAPATGADGQPAYAVTWEKWSPAAVAAAQQAGKFVYVDFTARWCATCQTNKAAVFHSDAVLAEFAKKNVVLLRGDWTNKDPLITAELTRWGRSAVPFNLIYAPTKPDPVVLPELLTPSVVLEKLAEAAK